jgi:hypothetical protein
MNSTAFLITVTLGSLLNVGLCTRTGSEPPAPPFPANCYSGQLAVKGTCMNYTIKVNAGNIDTSKFQATWTNPASNITYTNVFALANPCDFPAAINEGESFFFRIDTPRVSCATCQAFYPQPAKRLSITVLSQSCR